MLTRKSDHVSLQSVPLSTTLSSSDVITTLSDDSRYSRRSCCRMIRPSAVPHETDGQSSGQLRSGKRG
ncbi:hypothetical protein CEXT_635911 [Caerostris extrusa]|uniref:Uncharacterized protein n=1 Tax=Caerostris extrusa TaxID=172846 RepID=A0AAV4PE54_CAEEX|nr:hypothetical protein CEXT_635911 [Caerostris extrusa]